MKKFTVFLLHIPYTILMVGAFMFAAHMRTWDTALAFSAYMYVVSLVFYSLILGGGYLLPKEWWAAFVTVWMSLSTFGVVCCLAFLGVLAGQFYANKHSSAVIIWYLFWAPMFIAGMCAWHITLRDEGETQKA